MSIRMLPDLLTHGDTELGLPRRRGFAHVIGRANLAPREGSGVFDPSQAGEMAVREWVKCVKYDQ